MRRILIESARSKQSRKHGGPNQRIRLDDAATLLPADENSIVELLALHEALSLLEAEEPAKAQLVKLRYFAGLTLEEAAAALGISAATAKRHWIYARAWLYGKMGGD
jgi:RNA polymerase sigma factor (TIGR02999 family)